MKLNSIQFLRGVAALLVVYNHSIILQMKFSVSWQQNFYHLETFGCIGVDLFFVISGFIITYVTNKYVGVQQGIHFLVKRFWRINPVYYIACLLCLAANILLLWANNKPIATSLSQKTSALADSLLIIPITDNISQYSPLLVVGWTLAFEWLFYVLFIIIIFCNAKNKAFFISGFIALLFIAGLVLHPIDLRLIFLTNPIMLEFILGVVICQLYLKCKNIPKYVGLLCLATGLFSYLLLIFIGFGMVYYHVLVINGTVSLTRFLIWGIPSSCIVAGCVFLEKNGRFSRLFNNKWILLIGNASYSIYLLNLTIFNFLIVVYKKTAFPLPADIMIWLQFFIAVTISIGFYKTIEKPIIKHMPDFLGTFKINNSKTVPALPVEGKIDKVSINNQLAQ